MVCNVEYDQRKEENEFIFVCVLLGCVSQHNIIALEVLEFYRIRKKFLLLPVQKKKPISRVYLLFNSELVNFIFVIFIYKVVNTQKKY